MENLRIPSHLIHPLAIEVCKVLNEHKYQAFIVGGCVRDLILGKTPKDWDICTDASPKRVLEIFPKTIPTGLQHGTITVCMDEGVDNHFEVTTFRIEGEYSDGRRPDEVFFVMNIEQDLARRDLTINAIAYDPISYHLSDPFNGVKDLKSGIIRAVGKPDLRFQEDGLRIMRVARFASRFGYSVDSHTSQGIMENLDTLKKVSKERISDELCKTLMSANPSYGLHILLKNGALAIVCPLLSEHDLSHIDNQDKSQGELETKLAFLYSNLSAGKVEAELVNLKLSNKEIKRVVFLLQLLERFRAFQNKESASTYKSFMAVVKNYSPDAWEHTLQQFIELATTLELPVVELFAHYQHEVVLLRKEMQLNGNDLMEAGIPAGPRIKKALDECYLEILRHPELNTKYHLLEYSRKY